MPGDVWVSYPLKQGLKHGYPTQGRAAEFSLSQLSIKTRIETQTGRYGPRRKNEFESAIH